MIKLIKNLFRRPKKYTAEMFLKNKTLGADLKIKYPQSLMVKFEKGMMFYRFKSKTQRFFNWSQCESAYAPPCEKCRYYGRWSMFLMDGKLLCPSCIDKKLGGVK